ncbi:MAG TPA: hypothetical protein VHW69_18160 [Rhizomicrobium sp.]|jgi:hypothetical protein|nr:hypothetical protein [Rhizomicrobium sp.]
MENHLTRAQRYRALAAQMREASESESDLGRRKELMSLAEQYEHLADKLIGTGAIRTAAHTQPQGT